MSLPTRRWQDFEIIRKNNKRHDLHCILLANSVLSLWSVFFFNVFLNFNALWKDKIKLKANLLSSQKRDCTYLTVENGPITRPKYIKQYWFEYKFKCERVFGAVICAPRPIWNKPIRAQPQVIYVSNVYSSNRQPLVWRPAHTQTKYSFYFIVLIGANMITSRIVRLNNAISWLICNIQVHFNKLECRGKVNLFQ